MLGRGAGSFVGCAVFCGVSLLALAANAADMKPIVKARPEPAYVPQQVGNWGGLYAGGFVGGAHALWTVDFYRNNNHGHAEEGADGVAFGAFIGYNYHLTSHWVVGAEAEIGHTSAQQSNNIFDNDTSLAKYGTFGSLRGRLGYAYDRALFYATVELGFANVTNEIQKGRNAGEQVVWDDQWRSGLAAGGGIEYAFTDRIVGRVEYLYTDLGSVTLFNQDRNRAVFKNELHLVRAGASYKF